MAVVTKTFRSLNANWLKDISIKQQNDTIKNIYCGVSQGELDSNGDLVYENGKVKDRSFNPSWNNVSEAIQDSKFFLKCNVNFAYPTKTDYDAKCLTTNSYFSNNRVLGNYDKYWKYTDELNANLNNIYDIILSLDIKTINEKDFSYYNNIRHFYFLLNFRVNNEDPNQDYLVKNSISTYAADGIIVNEALNNLFLPQYAQIKLNYLISF